MLSKVATLCLLLSVGVQSVKVQSKLKTLAEAGWRAEDVNNFDWNLTQAISFSVVNAFSDVQASPTGDLYATQIFDTDVTEPVYQQYLYDPLRKQWNKYLDKQIVQVRFDRNGRMYQLLPDFCVYNDLGAKLLCNVKDFEVYEDGSFITIPRTTVTPVANYANGEFDQDPDTNTRFQAYSGYRALATQLEQPVLLNSNGTISGPEGNYNGVCAIDVTVGVDSSLWILQCSDNITETDYQILKWNPNKKLWYKIDGARGIHISAYNEISLGIIDSRGLLQVTSVQSKQKTVVTVATTNSPLTPTVRQLASYYLPVSTTNWLMNQIPGQYQKFYQCAEGASLNFSLSKGYQSCAGKGQGALVVYQNEYGKAFAFLLPLAIPNVTNNYALNTDIRFYDLQRFYNVVYYYGEPANQLVQSKVDDLQIGEFNLEDQCNSRSTQSQLVNYNWAGYIGTSRADAIGTANSGFRCSNWTIYYMTA